MLSELADGLEGDARLTAAALKNSLRFDASELLSGTPVKGGVHVAAGGPLTPHGFSRQEAARRLIVMPL